MLALHLPEQLGQAAFNQEMGWTWNSLLAPRASGFCALGLSLLLLVCLGGCTLPDVPLALACGLFTGPGGEAETVHYNRGHQLSTELHFPGVTPDLEAVGGETFTSTKGSWGPC